MSRILNEHVSQNKQAGTAVPRKLGYKWTEQETSTTTTYTKRHRQTTVAAPTTVATHQTDHAHEL